MATSSTATSAQTVANSMPPEMGVQPLRAFVDEIFGVPISNPNYPLEGFNEQTKFVQSLPELLFGQNKTNLGTRIIQQRLLDGNYFTQVLAPIRALQWGESLEIQWDSITFHPHIPQVVPEEGRTRIGSWEYSSGSDNINRYGLGFEMHHEALLDPRGQALARGLMDQINEGVEIHLKMGVMHTIIHAKDYALDRERQQFQATWKTRQIENFFERTRRYWGILQREEHAVQLVSNWIQEEQYAYGGKSNAVLLHWKLAMYVTVINPKFTEYWRIGDTAKETLDQGIDGFGSWGKHTVYIVRSFDVDRDAGPLDLLKRRVVYGEFYLMFDHIAHHYQSYEGYQTSWRSVQVMDGDGGNDRRSTIGLLEAARATNMWDENGDIIAPDDPMIREYVTELRGKDKRHSFWYTGSDGKPRRAALFGNVLKGYMSTDSIARLAYTAMASSPQVKGMYDAHEIARALETLSNAIRTMGNVRPEDADTLQEWYNLVIQRNIDNSVGEHHDGKVGCPPTAPGLLDWKCNKHGSLELPNSRFYQAEPIQGNPDVAVLLQAWGIDAAQARNSITKVNDVTTYNRFARIAGMFSLPPGFFSGSGLKTIAEAVATTGNAPEFATIYGLDYIECKRVADAVRVVQTLVTSLQRVFPGSLFLDANYVVSSNHRPDPFCAFVDNVLAQGRPSTFLRRATATYKASPASSLGVADAAADGRFIPTVDLTRAMDTIIGLGGKAAQDLQDRFLGRLTTTGNLLARYGPRFGAPAGAIGNALAIPAVTAVKAKLSVPPANVGAGVTDEHVAFDAQQAGSAELQTDANAGAALLAAMPQFAQQRFTAGDINAASKQYVLAAANPPAPAAGPFVYFYAESLPNPAGNDAVKAAYSQVVRVLLNFTLPFKANQAITADQAETIFEVYKRRAVVLALLTLVNDGERPLKANATAQEKAEAERQHKAATPAQRAAALATRFRNIFENILAPAGVQVPADTVQTNIERMSLQTLKDLVRNYFENNPEEAAETFGNGRSSGGKAVPRTAQVVLNVIDQIGQQAESSRDAIRDLLREVAEGDGGRGQQLGAAGGGGLVDRTGYQRGTAAGLPRYDPADYMRCDLRFSPEMFAAMYAHTAATNNAGGGKQRLPLALPADPEDNDAIISVARFRLFAHAIAENGSVVPAALAPTHLSDRKLGTSSTSDLPAISNVRLLKRKGVLVSTSTIGSNIPASLEASLRQSENYGITSKSNLVRYDEPPPAAAAAMETEPTRGRFRLPDVQSAEVTGPSYYRPNDRRVSGLAGSLQCIDASVDEHVASNGFQELWDQLDDLAQSDPALAAVGKVYLGTPTKWRNWEALARNNVVFPMTVLLARPLIVYDSYSLYFIQAGAETLITRFGQPLSTWSNESQRQVYSLTLAFKSKTTCINERNIYHVPNAFIAALHRGFGVQFFSRESFKTACVPDVPGRDSIVAIPEPYEPYLVRRPQAVLALTGKFKFLDFSFQDDPERNDALHYVNVYLANKIWGFQQFAKFERTDERTKMINGSALEPRFDFLVHAGQSLHWNPKDRAFTYKRASQGYFPDRVTGPGMCTVWRDSSKWYPEQNFTGFHDI